MTVFSTDQSWHPGELAPELERRGVHSFWVPEHTHIPVSRRTPPPTGEDPLPEMYKRTLDPFVALSYAAATTTTLRLGTGILLPAQRDPIITAKEAATLDHLSGGRLDLGIGFGWNADELASHGVAMKERRAVVEDRMRVMQELWGNEVGSYDGPHASVAPSWAWPKPAQTVTRDGVTRPGVPVHLGGVASETVFGHVVRYCQGWIPIGGAGLTEAIPALRRAVEAAGGDPDAVRVTTFGTLPTPEKLEHYASIGVTECTLRLPSAGRDEILRTLDGYARYLPG